MHICIHIYMHMYCECNMLGGWLHYITQAELNLLNNTLSGSEVTWKTCSLIMCMKKQSPINHQGHSITRRLCHSAFVDLASHANHMGNTTLQPGIPGTHFFCISQENRLCYDSSLLEKTCHATMTLPTRLSSPRARESPKTICPVVLYHTGATILGPHRRHPPCTCTAKQNMSGV